jgi:hypothetical protein
MMASVSGRRMSMHLPWPNGAVHVHRAAQRLDVARTTSMPTPRPDRLVTCSAVEKPGAKMSLRMSSSGGITPASTRPRSQARLPAPGCGRCRGRRRWMRIRMLPDSCRADSTSLPWPACRRPRAGGCFQAVVEAVAHQVHQRVGDALDHRLVELGVAALDLQRHVLAQLGSGVAHHAPEAREGLADGHHAQLQCAVADFLDQPADLLCWPRSARVARLTRQQRRAGAGDHQFAQQVDHGVEPVGLHADEAVVVGRPRAGAALALLLLQRCRTIWSGATPSH